MIDSIIEKAERLIAKYDTRNPYAIAAKLGIYVLNFDTPGTLKGMYSVIKRSRFIFVNESLDDELRRFVCAHELGHDILHRHLAENGGLKESSFFDMKSKPEMEANVFAANLMISDKEVMSYAEEGYTAEDMSKELYVPYPLALIKLNDMNKRGFNLNIPYNPKADFLGGE